MYCKVEKYGPLNMLKRVVEGPVSKRRNPKTVSLGVNATDAEWIKHGWYPAEITQPSVDPLLNKVGDWDFTIQKDKVAAQRKVVNLSTAERDAARLARTERRRAEILERMRDCHDRYNFVRPEPPAEWTAYYEALIAMDPRTSSFPRSPDEDVPPSLTIWQWIRNRI